VNKLCIQNWEGELKIWSGALAANLWRRIGRGEMSGGETGGGELAAAKCPGPRSVCEYI